MLSGMPEAAFDRWTTWLSDVLGVKVAALSLVDRDRQFLHDRIAGTYVVKVPRNWPLP